MPCTTSGQLAYATSRAVSLTSRRDRVLVSASLSASRSPASRPRTTTIDRDRHSSARMSAATTIWRLEKASTLTAPTSSETESSCSQIRPGYHTVFSHQRIFLEKFTFAVNDLFFIIKDIYCCSCLVSLQ